MPMDMASREEIFPSQKREAYGQTEWAAGWMSTANGFGEAARRLADQRRQIGVEIDQIGVAIFYLQRHRVELLIEGALDELGCAPEEVFRLGHDLRRHWLHLGAEIESAEAFDAIIEGCIDWIDEARAAEAEFKEL